MILATVSIGDAHTIFDLITAPALITAPPPDFLLIFTY